MSACWSWEAKDFCDWRLCCGAVLCGCDRRFRFSVFGPYRRTTSTVRVVARDRIARYTQHPTAAGSIVLVESWPADGPSFLFLSVRTLTP
jgi:hypothetical protein